MSDYRVSFSLVLTLLLLLLMNRHTLSHFEARKDPYTYTNKARQEEKELSFGLYLSYL